MNFQKALSLAKTETDMQTIPEKLRISDGRTTDRQSGMLLTASANTMCGIIPSSWTIKI